MHQLGEHLSVSIRIKGGDDLLLGVIAAFFIYCYNISSVYALQPMQHSNETIHVSESQEVSSGPDLEDKVDRTHEMLSDGILNTARWMDSFFYDERFAQEENRTRIKFRLSTFLEEAEEVEYKFRADIRLVLPGFEDRLALAFSGDDEEEGIGLNAKNSFDVDSLERTNKEDTSISLRYIIKTIERRNISATLGFRLRSSRLVTAPEIRWRENFAYKDWELRFVQRLRWFSDVGWEEKTSIDLDRLLYKIYLFRTTVDGTWSEKDEFEKGYIYNLNFSLFHPLTPNRAMIYELNNNFQTKPVDHLEKIVLRTRFRQRLWRDWIFLEIAPQLAFPDEEEFSATPGITLSMDAIVGHYDKK